ncbi:MAG TPA: alkyl hydroperoxide reductase [Phycisphaerales bacterium]|nr:alkyl hydroperoxide reductase [Phycisphaerales bacterium]
MTRSWFGAAMALLLAPALALGADPAQGPWRAVILTPGGELPFGLTLARAADGAWGATIHNGSERIDIPEVRVEGDAVSLAIDYFDSRIEARVVDEGRSLIGTWSKRRGPGEPATLEFRAAAGALPRFFPIRHPRGTEFKPIDWIGGPWRVAFQQDADGAIGRFESKGEGVVHATFLTPTGDYRYLEGTFDGQALHLSCFDGAHAFLFSARVDGENELRGEFFSGDWHRDPFTAVRDPGARLVDPWKQTAAPGAPELAALTYRTPSGEAVTLADDRFAGRARIIEVFGTWCPNCKDAGAYLSELHARYAPRGLSIVGLAFEVTGDAERDAAQVATYAQRLRTPYPLLLAGVSDKTEASRAFPLVDRVRSYPTFVFLDGSGAVRAIYTGFSGPATGEDHARLRREFEALIERLLDE